MTDLRVDLILRVKTDHQCIYASTREGRKGERDECRCGAVFSGDGALRLGDRHRAEMVLSALDEAAMVP